MTVSEKRKASNAKWDRENMVKLGANVTRSYAAQVKAKAAEKGRSIHSIIKDALDAFLAED